LKTATPLRSVFWIPRRNVRPDVPSCEKPEYVPPASQCQMSTAAPVIGLHVETSITVVRSVSGTPGLPSRTSRRSLSPSSANGPGVISGDPGQLARVKVGGGMAALASMVGVVVLFALAGHPERLGRAALRIERVLPARLARMVAGFVETFAQGLAVLRDPARLATALAMSIPMWMSIAAGIWLSSRAFHITYPYPASFLVMTILVVGVAAPTPGAIGGFHAAYIFAVTTFFGVDADRAGAAAIVLHAISFVPITLLGIVFMMREGLTLAGARRLAKEAPGGSGATTGLPPAHSPSGVDPAPHAPARAGGGEPGIKKGAP